MSRAERKIQKQLTKKYWPPIVSSTLESLDGLFRIHGIFVNRKALRNVQQFLRRLEGLRSYDGSLHIRRRKDFYSVMTCHEATLHATRALADEFLKTSERAS